MSQMQVTNHTSRPLRGRFAGQDYLFPPNKPVALSQQAATHIFGLGQPDKTRALNNLGILVGEITYTQALAVLEQISFVEGHMVYESQTQQPPPGQGTPQQEPGKPGPHQPGQKPGEPAYKPGEQPQKGPGKDEEHEESEESGGRPGAPRSPGRKSEAGESQASPASDDPQPKRKW